MPWTTSSRQHLGQLPAESSLQEEPLFGESSPPAPPPVPAEDPLSLYYSVQAAEWQAHPSTSPPHPPSHGSHCMTQLFHLNALEWAASSVEVTAVAAKDVALLAFNRWYQDLDKIDQKDLMHKVKTEL